jgi:hypothetical protein
MPSSPGTQLIDIPLGMDHYEPRKVWRSGVPQKEKVVAPEAVMFFGSKEAAQHIRERLLMQREVDIWSDVAALTVAEATESAREFGVFRVEIYDINLELLEWWLV